MDINLTEYNDAIRKVTMWINKRKVMFDAYDIVHETLLQYNCLQTRNLRGVYFMFYNLTGLKHKSLRDLPIHKTCKGCSPGDLLPIAMFYIHYYRNGNIFPSTLCKECYKAASAAVNKSKKDDPHFKALRRKISNSYNRRWRAKVISRRKAAYAKNLKDPTFRSRVNSYKRDWYAKKKGETPRKCKRKNM